MKFFGSPLILLPLCSLFFLSDGDPPVDWVEGVAIIVALLIVVGVGSLNDWQKEKQFEGLNEKREECSIKVIRDSVMAKIQRTTDSCI